MSTLAQTGPSLARLTLLHTRYQFIETIRVPMAVIGTLVFPALALVFFVVPQRAVMVNALFGFGLAIAESRGKPWDPYLRTLPAPGLARVLALMLSTGTLGLLAVIPVIVAAPSGPAPRPLRD